MTLDNDLDAESKKRQISFVTAAREIVGPPQAPACGVSFLGEPSQKKSRAALYIDGFNLYHAIDKLKKPHLKWVNLWSLGELILPTKSQKLIHVVYCSAKKTGDFEKQKRHQEIITAYKCMGIIVKLGHFNFSKMDCRSCGSQWDAPSEKESDVNIALSILDDAYQDVFDHAYLITADSDQGATARVLKERFPKKTLTSVSPPLMSHSKSIMAHTQLRISLSPEHLEKCLLPPMLVQDVGGKSTLRFRRPSMYAPPA